MLLRREVAVRSTPIWPPILIITTLLCGGLAFGTYEANRVMQMCGDSKPDVARAHADWLAHDAFPAWSARHPHACPGAMDDLGGESKDPWGSNYQLLCADPRAIIIMSAGEDGIFGTADDVRSSDSAP